jgi:hypothetical protein
MSWRQSLFMRLLDKKKSRLPEFMSIVGNVVYRPPGTKRFGSAVQYTDKTEARNVKQKILTIKITKIDLSQCFSV